MKNYSRYLLPLLIACGVCFADATAQPVVAATMTDLELTEAQDEAKLGDFIRMGLMPAVLQARQAGDFAREIAIDKRVVELWTSKHYKTPAVEDSKNTDLRNAYLDLADAQRRSGQYDQAAETYLQCNQIAVARRTGEFNAQNYQDPAGDLPSVAEAYKDGKHFDKAEKIYIDLVNLEPKPQSITYSTALAKVYEAAGNLEKAEEVEEGIVQDGIKDKSVAQVRSARNYLKRLFESQHRAADVEKIESALNDRHCPICGSEANVVPIVRGQPKDKNPRVHTVWGCLSGADDFKWWCNTDNTPF